MNACYLFKRKYAGLLETHARRKKKQKCISFHSDLRQFYGEMLTESQVTEDETINHKRKRYWYK